PACGRRGLLLRIRALHRALPASGRRVAGPGGRCVRGRATERAHHEFWRGRRRSFRGEPCVTGRSGPVQRDRRWAGSRPRNGTYPARDRSGACAGVHLLHTGQRRRDQRDGVRGRLLRRLATPAGHRGARNATTVPLSALGPAPLHRWRRTDGSPAEEAVTVLPAERRCMAASTRHRIVTLSHGCESPPCLRRLPGTCAAHSTSLCRTLSPEFTWAARKKRALTSPFRACHREILTSAHART